MTFSLRKNNVNIKETLIYLNWLCYWKFKKNQFCIVNLYLLFCRPYHINKLGPQLVIIFKYCSPINKSDFNMNMI